MVLRLQSFRDKESFWRDGFKIKTGNFNKDGSPTSSFDYRNGTIKINPRSINRPYEGRGGHDYYFDLKRIILHEVNEGHSITQYIQTGKVSTHCDIFTATEVDLQKYGMWAPERKCTGSDKSADRSSRYEGMKNYIFSKTPCPWLGPKN